MTNSIVFNCTALVGSNKAGVLKPDKNGYYDVVLGAFDFKNSAGENYPFTSAKHLFKSSSSLMRRINNGQCRGELGHPSKESGMSYRDYIERILEIREDKVSHHIKALRVDNQSVTDKDNRPIVAVIGKVKPSGPYGDILRESIDNPDENVAFSLRSLVEQGLENGVVQKHIKTLITYDYVNEPGISIANKYQSPGLESIEEECPITLPVLESIQSDATKSGLEYKKANIEIIKTELGWSKSEITYLPSLNW